MLEREPCENPCNSSWHGGDPSKPSHECGLPYCDCYRAGHGGRHAKFTVVYPVDQAEAVCEVSRHLISDNHQLAQEKHIHGVWHYTILCRTTMPDFRNTVLQFLEILETKF
jgi:hypothetical protein